MIWSFQTALQRMNGIFFFASVVSKAEQEKYNAINRGNRRSKSYQHKGGLRQLRKEDGHGNTHAECRSDPLKHYRDTVAASIKITDAAEKHAGQQAVSRKPPQVRGALCDYFGITGEKGGHYASAKESSQKNNNSYTAPGYPRSNNAFPCTILFSRSNILSNKGRNTLHNRGRQQHNERGEFLCNAIPSRGH